MLYVLDWCVVCTGLVCCMYWTGVLYVLDWCVVCTGLVCCMYWTGVLYVLDWPYQSNTPARYIYIPVQFNTPVQYIIHCMCCVACTQLVCCMRGEERGWGIALAPLLKREGGGEK